MNINDYLASLEDKATVNMEHVEGHTWFNEEYGGEAVVAPVWLGGRPAIRTLNLGVFATYHLPVLASEYEKAQSFSVEGRVKELANTCPYTEAVPCFFGSAAGVTELALHLGEPKVTEEDQ